jgi:hypothetical protein
MALVLAKNLIDCSIVSLRQLSINSRERRANALSMRLRRSALPVWGDVALILTPERALTESSAEDLVAVKAALGRNSIGKEI